MTPDQLKTRLEAAYPDGTVDVVDLTGTHDHYQVAVTSGAFKGLSRIQAHKHVMNVFDAELKTGEVHALTIKTTVKE
ncbi:MAG TPA: BolA/IbaG family iron-sulfur metabolism protein [Bdellovibrionales bacterium]|nr:BolA/IbaG family iron-sulfur metabolism protein [Bdellovibrionales bacterium]